MTQREIAIASAIVVATLAIIIGTVLGFRGNDLPEVEGGDGSVPSSQNAVKEPLSVLWVGDSFPAGTGTVKGDSAQGLAVLTAHKMGWILNLDAQGATGFLNDGHVDSSRFTTVINRLPADVAKFKCDVVVLDVGRNDSYFPQNLYRPAIQKYLAAFKRAYPKARIVEITPYSMTSTAGSVIGHDLNDEVRKAGGFIIDPIKEGWIGPNQPKGLVAPDNSHPNPAGHEYVATHLTADLHKLGFASTKRPR